MKEIIWKFDWEDYKDVESLDFSSKSLSTIPDEIRNAKNL